MKLSILAKEINAQLHGPDMELPLVAIDSRKIQGGEMFVAIKGENLDGHDFIGDAIAKGAKAILAGREPQTTVEKNITFLQVKDPNVALGELAAFWRRLHPIPLVGITGSCGKTTVKGMIEAICQQQGKTLATQGNFNNHIGLPLTLLRLDPTYQFAVIEMGANHMGEIAYLGKIARPTATLITNVRPAHIQGFGSVEKVAQAKGEIYQALPAEGIAIINQDEPFNDYWRTLIQDREMITFGLEKPAMVSANDVVLKPFSSEFVLKVFNQQRPVTIQVPGKHMIMNALAAASAGIALGIPLERIVEGLAAFHAVSGRLKRFVGVAGSCVIDDSYNANPGSMIAALEVLAGCQGERLFVMGDMAELGPDAASYHEQIGQFARQKGVNRLFAVGKLSAHAVQAFGNGAQIYANKEELIQDLKPLITQQSIILIKGSRSAGMEIVTQALTLSEA